MPEPKVVAIIQARMSSTRLPGKVLADIEGRPMLWHVMNRVGKAHLVDQVVVATSKEPADNAIAMVCAQYRIACFRGSETDVLDRFYQTAKHFKADVVVRITADCPLIDPAVTDIIIRKFVESDFDYVTNTLRLIYPDGMDVEVFSFEALEDAWRERYLPTHREHVTPYIRTSGRFQVHNVENEVELSCRNLRLSVDEPCDLELVRAIYAQLGSEERNFGLADVLRLLQEQPHLMKINAGIIYNEGYYRTVAKEPALPPHERRLACSHKLKAKAEAVIPSCSQTFSKGPTQFVGGVAPVFLRRGQGSHVWDVDGNEYIDYPMALGPIILGHNYPSVNEAVMRQMQDGTIFSLPHPLEVELAELLVKTIPSAEMVRFGKNGSDVTSGAIRVARAYTGRDIIACCGYHGWQDWYIGTTTRNMGVPKAVQELTIAFEYNNIGNLKDMFALHPGKIAAVIMEPIGLLEPHDGFLEQVRDLTHSAGALLIFDEVVTGFRVALGGAQEYFGVMPDLACFGKGMANGYPIAAIVGRRQIMELFDDVFFSFTFGGETLSLSAAFATVTEMHRNGVIPHLWEQGRKLKDGYTVLSRQFGVERYTECIGLPPRTVITFKDQNGEDSLLLKSLFQQECFKRGVLFSGGQNICYSHSDGDIDYTLRVYRAAMGVMADSIKKGNVAARLEGDPVQPVFRRP